jgi:hypothetical protein
VPLVFFFKPLWIYGVLADLALNIIVDSLALLIVPGEKFEVISLSSLTMFEVCFLADFMVGSL